MDRKHGYDTRRTNPIPSPWLQLVCETQVQNGRYHTIEKRGVLAIVLFCVSRVLFCAFLFPSLEQTR